MQYKKKEGDENPLLNKNLRNSLASLSRLKLLRIMITL